MASGNERRTFRAESDSSIGLHGVFWRCEIRKGERVAAELSWETGGKNVTTAVAVWRLSPIAIELALPLAQVAPGLETEVALLLTLGDARELHPRLRVSAVELSGESRRLLLRWDSRGEDAPEDTERRGKSRWLCTPEFLPTGVAPNPIRFNDILYFRITEISANGMVLMTSLRNHLMVPGLRLDASVTLPASGTVSVQMKVVHSRVLEEAGKQWLSVGVSWDCQSAQVKTTVARYLQQFGPPVRPEVLRAQGLPVSSLLHGVEFSYVQDEKDYLEVLALRKLAYQTAGKIPAEASVESTGDVFDARARIVTARCRGELVASLRLMFHDAGQPMEHEQYTSWPEGFPAREETIEVTRVCTHPSYRGGDLLQGLFRHGMIICAQSGRRWMVGSSTDKLLRIYRRMGFHLTNLQFRHLALGAERHTVFVGDIRRALLGDGIHPIVWNLLYADAWSYVDKGSLPGVGLSAAIRMGLYRLCKPIADVLGRTPLRKRGSL